MAHLARQQFVGFLGLLALRDIEKDAEHDPVGDVSIVSLASSGNPADVAAGQNTEINFVGTDNRARRGKCRPHSLQIGGMNVSGQYPEGDLRFGLRYLPKFVSAFIHGDRVGVDVP